MDDGAVHDGGAHADEAVIMDGAAMQGNPMADSYPIPDRKRIARRVVGAAGMADMQDAVILNVAALADTDAIDVTADDRKRPDGTVTADFDFANDQRGVVDINAIADFGARVFKCTKFHIV